MIVGTAGHIDHGKTALVKALTGVDADRLAEEKARGITIDLGFAYVDLGSGAITGFVDVPGHERLIHTMLAGAGGIDFALLVVAADDGVMPQTREHFTILSMLGLSRGVVAMTKVDLANADRRAEVANEVRQLLAGSRLAEAPIVPLSIVSGEGVADLRKMLTDAEDETSARATNEPFRLAVDRSFTLSGIGAVATGTVLSGRIAVGDNVVISPSGLRARVRGIHAQNKPAQEGLAGQRCALNLAGDGVSKEAIKRGNVLVARHLHAPSNRIDATLMLLGGETKAVTTWHPARLHTNSEEVGARLVPLAGDIAPGETGIVQLVLDQPIAAAVGDRFVLRDVSATRTIGGGRFLDLRAPARKRGTPVRLAWLAAAQEIEPASALRALLDVGPVDLPVFLRDRCLPPESGQALAATAGAEMVSALALGATQIAALRTSLIETLTAFHADNPDLPGLGPERLRLALTPRLPKEAFVALLNAEAAAGTLVLDGAFLRLPDHAVQLSSQDEALFKRILPALTGDLRFRPPRVRDFADEFGIDEREVRRVLKLSQKLGRTDQIAHDHFFARAVTQEMAAIIKRLAGEAADGWFTAMAFRDVVQNGRKVAIEILDFYDRLGLTLRRGDLRRINLHRADLFDS